MLAFGLVVVFIVFVCAVSRSLKSGDTPGPALRAVTPVAERPVILPAAPPVPTVDRYSLTPQEQQLVDKHKELFDHSLKVDIAGITIAPSRRTAMEHLAPYQFLVLRREHDNPYDRNAIKVKVGGNHVLGWVPRVIAKDIAADLDAGRIWMAMYPHAMRDDGSAPIATMILLRVTDEIAVQLNPDHRPVLRTAINMDTANKIVVRLGETRARTVQRHPIAEVAARGCTMKCVVLILCTIALTTSGFTADKTLSRDFTKAGIRATEMIKAVEYASPPSEAASETQQNEARKALVDAKLAISNDADRSANVLLADTFELRQLAVVDARDPNDIDSWERDAKAMQQCLAEAVAVIDPDSLPNEWRERAAAKKCVAMHDSVVAEIMKQK